MNSGPARYYFFSDTYGGSETANPFARADADALICTDYGCAGEHPIRREFDIFGTERVTDHILRLVLQQHDAFAQRTDISKEHKRRFLAAGTHVFINSAPRIDGRNGHPFYIATPLTALSAVRDNVESLEVLPNPGPNEGGNGLYESNEQFRSRLTPSLFCDDSLVQLTKVDPSTIPPYKQPWHVAYIDRFGNIVTWVNNVERQWDEIRNVSGATGAARNAIKVTIGQSRSRTVLIGKSLAEAVPGSLSIYCNGNIDIVRKWTPSDQSSAYALLNRPSIGDLVRIL
jgi:hypothetical protein